MIEIWLYLYYSWIRIMVDFFKNKNTLSLQMLETMKTCSTHSEVDTM